MRLKTTVAAAGAVLLLVLVVHPALLYPHPWEVPSGGTSESPDVSVLLSVGSPPTSPETHHPLLILIHDVSPVYSSDLREITDVISEYGFQNETYLFLITDHAGKHPITEYPRFLAYLKTLEREGYHIELHAYTHTGREFYCSPGEAEYRLEMALGLMASANLSRPELFIPPRYAISRGALGVLLASNLTVINGTRVYLPNGTEYTISNHEYTWYLPYWKLPVELWRAERDFKNTRGTFYLSVHPKAVNSGAGMLFLRDFLVFVKEEEAHSSRLTVHP